MVATSASTTRRSAALPNNAANGRPSSLAARVSALSLSPTSSIESGGDDHDGERDGQQRTQGQSHEGNSKRPHRRSPPRPLKIVIIGPHSVGKTSLRQKYFTGRFQNNYRATIGADFEAKVVEYRANASGHQVLAVGRDGKVKGKGKGKGKGRGLDQGREADAAKEVDMATATTARKALLTVWDTAGQERFRALGSAFYRGADAVIICFDASATSEEEVRASLEEWFQDFMQRADLSQEQRRNFCWVAVGCKADTRREGAVSRWRVRRLLNALIPRGRCEEQESGDGTPGAKGREIHGDAPPADPHEVLAREGRHSEDDRELSMDTGKVDDGDTETAEPERPEYQPQTNGQAAVDSTSAAAATPTKASPATPIKKTKSQMEEHSEHLAFPKSSSSSHLGAGEDGSRPAVPQTPPAQLHPYSSGAGQGQPRNRYDSTLSVASSSHISVYHTPRNSTMWGGSRHAGVDSVSDAETSKPGSVSTHNGSPLGARKQQQQQQTPSMMGTESSDAKTVNAGGDDEARTADHQTADVNADNSIKQPQAQSSSRPAMLMPEHSDRTVRRPRALSTPSIQSLAENEGSGDDRDTKQSRRGAPSTQRSTRSRRAATHGPDSSFRRQNWSDLLPPRPLSGFSLFYTSAKTGAQVDAVFEHVVSRCVRQWEREEYQSAVEEQRQSQRAKERSEDRGGTKKRRSFFWGSGRRGEAGAWGEEEQMREETRRMVRLSDGKGDDNSRLAGCC